MFLAAPVFLVSIYVQLIMKSLILSQVYIERILHKYNLKATLTGNFYEKYGNYQNEFKTKTTGSTSSYTFDKYSIMGLWQGMLFM